MKLCSFVAVDGSTSFGHLEGTEIVDLGADEKAGWRDLKSFLAASPEEASRGMPRQPKRHSIDSVRFLPVIPNPGKVICVGHNYEEHRLETGRPKVDFPSLFLRLPDSQVGHQEPLTRPRESTMLDYEGEIAIVIGTGGRRIAEADASRHIAGYSCYNDGSVRDWQWHTSQFTAGKNFSGTGGFGPYLVTPDEMPPDEPLNLETRVNGRVMQQASTKSMIFSIPRLIAYCSSFTPLQAGDVIVTGTPGGVGAKREPPVWLKAGDVVEVEVTHVGRLCNPVVDD